MSLHGKNGLWAIVLVVRSVLSSIDAEESGCFVSIESGTGNVNVWSFAHVVDVGRNKLKNGKANRFSIMEEGMMTNMYNVPYNVKDVVVSEGVRGTVAVC